ncbi:glycosyltransferase family 39 protein [Antrihabitans cavernicola]|uniref:glycosyltransferase family 39 protein n=1 Tax=Antrihabitans cavernicola TaxID=2495913 RepID=UPI001F1E7079|nr:glycosyltransferase family 39 protein [Spelaeibacter cavernicola]
MVLTASSGRYGYHRDELYFLASSKHLAWGYVDQPPLTPLLVRAMTVMDDRSLPLLRVPATLAAVGVVVVTALMAREFGGGRRAQLIASFAVVASAVVLGAGHLMGTTIFDLLVWATLCLLVIRLCDGRDPRWWLAVGAIVGIGLQNKTLVVFVVAALLVGILSVGPRRVLRTWWLAAGIVIALGIWAPNLWCQASNGWPQLEMSRSIAAGVSGTSSSRAEFVITQLGLIGPLLIPVWIAGLWWLFRSPSSKRWRALGIAYPILFVVYFGVGGKAYYLAGLYPVLLAAGALVVSSWSGRGRARVRLAVVAIAVTSNAVIAAVLFLPVVAPSRLPGSVITAVNYDAGETVGWPEYVSQVATVRDSLPDDDRGSVAILTANYGEAGAVERFGGRYGLPLPQSVHNAYWSWGPPSDAAAAVITVGFQRNELRDVFARVDDAGRLHNAIGLNNDEQGASIFVCRGPLEPWSQLWPKIRRLG